jgi:hypothetical protein
MFQPSITWGIFHWDLIILYHQTKDPGMLLVDSKKLEPQGYNMDVNISVCSRSQLLVLFVINPPGS